jgi:hypothetical protein
MSQKENADHIGCDVKVIRVLQQDTSAMPVRRRLVEELTEIPKRRTGASAKTLRPVLGPIRLAPTNGDIGRACCVVKTSIEAVTVLEPSDAENRRCASKSL